MDFPRLVRADRLLGNRLRLGVYGGLRLDTEVYVTREYAVVWVLRGEGVYHDEHGRETPFGPGDVYQRFPGKVHGHLWKDARKGLTCFAAIPAPLLAGLRLSDPPGLNASVFHAGLDEDLALRWGRLAREVRDAPAKDLVRHLAAVLALVCDLHGRCAEQVHQDGWIDRARGLIDAHLLDRIPMPVVLAPLGGSYAANRARFARLTGHSPGAWRVRRRLELAQDLLASEDIPVAEVADRLGFDEPSNFSKQFRRHCGCSPGEFRGAFAG